MNALTAIHEASHCVVSHAIGAPCKGMSIKPTGRMAGYFLGGESTETGDLKLHHDVMMSVAGIIGEEILQGKPIQQLDGIDGKRFQRIQRVKGADFTTKAYHEARNILTQNWRLVEALAKELEEKETLSADDIDRIIKATLKRTAYHEAGHAIMMLLNAVPVKRVTIMPGRENGIDFRGMTSSRDLLIGTKYHVAVRGVLISMAGHVAEEIYLGQQFNDFSGTDYAAFIHYAGMLMKGEKQKNAFLSWAIWQGEEMLREKWTDVEAVAEALLSKKTLTGEEIKTIIGIPAAINDREITVQADQVQFISGPEQTPNGPKRQH